jgi:hypothetical protein
METHIREVKAMSFTLEKLATTHFCGDLGFHSHKKVGKH